MVSGTSKCLGRLFRQLLNISTYSTVRQLKYQIVAIALLTIFACETVSGELPEKIADDWEFAASEIETATIAAYFFHTRAEDGPLFTEAIVAVEAFFEQAFAVEEESYLKSAMDLVVYLNGSDNFDTRWGTLLMKQSGSNVRNTFLREGIDVLTFAKVSGHPISYFDSFNEVIVGDRGFENGARDVQTFRYIPDSIAPWTVDFSNSERIGLKRNDRPMTILEINAEDSLPVKQIDGSSQYKTFGYYKEFPPGIDSPQLGCNISFSNGKVSTFYFFMIQNAVFNKEISTSELTGTYKKGVRVHDHRDPSNVKAGLSQIDGNAFEIADSIKSRSRPIVSNSGKWSLIAVTVCIFVVSYIVYRCRSFSRIKEQRN